MADGGCSNLDSDGDGRPEAPGNCPSYPAPDRPDAEGNGAVSSIDAALVLQYDARLVAALPCGSAADADQDGAVNSIDAALILQLTAGLVAELPVRWGLECDPLSPGVCIPPPPPYRDCTNPVYPEFPILSGGQSEPEGEDVGIGIGCFVEPMPF